MLLTRIHSMNGFNDFQKRQLNLAVRYKKEIENSQLFKYKFLEANFSGETSHLRNLTNLEKYIHYMKGEEVVGNKQSNVVDFYLVAYYSWKRVVGYTYPNVNKIYLNTRILNNNSVKLIGSNLAHEYCHNIGFDHDFRRTARRYNSVPYQVNRIYEECFNTMFNGMDDDHGRLVFVPWYRKAFNFFRRLF